ncbi:hypothetical protein MRX96_058243 [Rhipicephalus microplus]
MAALARTSSHLAGDGRWWFRRPLCQNGGEGVRPSRDVTELACQPARVRSRAERRCNGTLDQTPFPPLPPRAGTSRVRLPRRQPRKLNTPAGDAEAKHRPV